MKIAVRLCVIVILSIIVSSVWDSHPDEFLIQSIYTVAGIIFSIGLSLVVTFSMHGLKKKSYISDIRRSLLDIRKSFISYFAASTIFLIINNYIGSTVLSKEMLGIKIELSISILSCFVILYTIIYFITNMILLQKLNNDLFDKLNEE